MPGGPSSTSCYRKTILTLIFLIILSMVIYMLALLQNSNYRTRISVSDNIDLVPISLEKSNPQVFKVIRSDAIPEYKLLLNNMLSKVKGNGTELILFKGRRTPLLFDIENYTPHISINSSSRESYRFWEDLVHAVNKTSSLESRNKALQIHITDVPLSYFLMWIVRSYHKRKRIELPFPSIPVKIPTRMFHSLMDQGQRSIVITDTIDENWGLLSTFIRNRTANWGNLTKELADQCSSYETIHQFLDSDKVTLLQVNTHIDPAIGFHRKLISFPLGLSQRIDRLSKARELLENAQYSKTKLLMINNSGWGGRRKINDDVIARFANSVNNTYGHTYHPIITNSTDGRSKYQIIQPENFLQEIAMSKFVLCPSGLGFDSFRIWETILFGSIPVVESNPGLDRTYASLPVLILRSFDDLTPQLLEKMYPCFVENANNFRFDHMLISYWLNLVSVAVHTGNIDHVMDNHPFRHKFCNVLS